MIARLQGWIWQELAWLLTLPIVVDWLIARSARTPYRHLQDPDGSYYMQRFWLFNPYEFQQGASRTGWRSWFPSVRLHHIMRRDLDEHMHDHPWEARTVILRGYYKEERLVGAKREEQERKLAAFFGYTAPDSPKSFLRLPGDTCKLTLGMFHNITQVSEGGVWTLFITWKYQGTWGFRVAGKKVPYREYLQGNLYGRPQQKEKAK